MVKIGGYDDFCIKDEKDFKLLETMYSDRWVLKSKQGKVGTAQSNYIYNRMANTPKHVVIEPQLPYIYVSENDYKNWVAIVKAQFNPNEISYNCEDTTWGGCIFQKSCKDLPDVSLDLKVNLFDDK